jgi:hypothetical protein
VLEVDVERAVVVVVRSSRTPMAKRSIALAAWKPSPSYIVTDQNAPTGGSSAASKRRT